MELIREEESYVVCKRTLNNGQVDLVEVRSNGQVNVTLKLNRGNK